MRLALIALFVPVAFSGCESCGSCIGEQIADRVVAHSDAGPEAQACPIPADKQALVGVWRNESADFLLAVHSDCRVAYRHSGTKVNAPLMSFYGNDFSIGMFGMGPTFKVAAMPHDVGAGTWKMTVDGVELTKTNEAPGDVIAASSID